MRIAMIGLRAPGAEGGVEGHVEALAPRLVQRGWDVTVFCRRGYNRRGNAFDGVRLVDLRTVQSRSTEAILHSLNAALRTRAFDLVHLHAVGNALVAPIPRLFGVPVVVTVHGPDWTRDKWGPVAKAALWAGARVAGRWADEVIAVSRDTADRLGRLAAPVTVIPNGVELTAPVSAAELPAGLAPGFLLYLGRLVPEKAVEVLIEAHARAPGAAPLVIAGSAGHTEGYAAGLRAKVRSDVRFVGTVSGSAKAAVLQHCGAMVSASRVEGLPLSVLEGMAHGRVVIASDIGPHRELLGESAGVLVPTDDVGGFARAMVGRFATGEAAQMRAEREFSWDAVADATDAVYRRAIAEAAIAGDR